MNKSIRISEIFESVQGEGKYAGYPMLFIRTSGCTRACWYCDTKYHPIGKNISIDDLVKKIKKSKTKIVCWTGGEPLMRREEIFSVISKTKNKQHHIETNGDLLQSSDMLKFDYVACSPKELPTAINVKKLLKDTDEGYYDIKVVTDLKKEGVDMVKYATMLMPLTYTNHDKEIQKDVWNYCIKNNLKFSSRLQYFVWGKKRAI